MNRVLRLSALCAVLSQVPTVKAAEPKKLDEAAVRAKLLAGAASVVTVEGKFTTLDLENDEKKLVLTYVYQTRTPKKDGYKKYYDAAVRYNAALERRDASLEEIKKLKKAVDDAYTDGFDVEEIPVHFDLKITEKTPIRVSGVPLNEDGTPMKLTPAQLAKLKGDPKLPGYTAQLADLNKLNRIQVQIDKSKVKKTDDGPVYPATLIMIVLAKEKEAEEFQPAPLK